MKDYEKEIISKYLNIHKTKLPKDRTNIMRLKIDQIFNERRDSKKMKVALELLRIIVVFSLLGAFGWVVIENIYTVNEITKNYSSLAILAIFILIIMLYSIILLFYVWSNIYI